MKALPAFLAVVAMALGGLSFAQSGGTKGSAVGLKGVDPVSYFNPGKPANGMSAINFDFDDTRYLFVSKKNRETFAANPERYAPQFGGLCATGLSAGMKAESDPRIFKIVGGKLYVFSSTEARDMADKDPTLLKKAHQAWVKPGK
jgi:YHS domain-containing protein